MNPPPAFSFGQAGDDVVCLGQIRPEDVAALAAQGVRTIVCNRPDEEAGAVPSEAIEAAARALGLSFVYQPVQFGRLTPADGAAFARTLDRLPGAVAAYCRTGRRSAALWVFAPAPRQGVEAALGASRAAGSDLEELRPRLG